MLAPFKALDLPVVTGKTFVLFNTGRSWRPDGKLAFEYLRGWLLSEDEKSVVLLRENLTVTAYRRDLPLPPDWEKVKGEPADLPVPGSYVALDFEDVSRKWCDEGVPEELDHWGHVSERNDASLLRPAACALFAFWELERGHSDIAIKLVDLGRRWASGPSERVTRGERDRGASLEDEIGLSLAENLRWQAVLEASRGVERPELLRKWKLVAESLPETPWTGEAASMVKLYENLVAEDERFVAVPRDELAKRDVASRVAYWIHELRDVKQWAPLGPGSLREGQPADELVRLGWAAIPDLIEHLDDERPTRMSTSYRAHVPSSFDLLRYADCSSHALYAITGIHFPSRVPGVYGTESHKAQKKAALEWWKDARTRGPEKEWLAVLDAPDVGYPWSVAAEGLLGIDAKKYLPILLELVRREPEKRLTLLQDLAPRLGKEHASFLLEVLGDTASFDLASSVAGMLRDRCDDERGTERMLAILGSWTATEQSYAAHLNLDWSLGFIARSRPMRPELVEKFVRLMESDVRDVRIGAIKNAWRLPCEKTVVKLVAALGDTKAVGIGPIGSRFCDLAACSLRRTFALPIDHDFENATVVQRDELIVAVQKFWSESGAKVRWDDVRRAIDAELARER